MVLGPTGGIQRLCELVDEYGDELEADFRQFYGLRLRDAFSAGGTLSAGEALVLAGQLGTVPDSRFRAMSLGGLEFAGWSREADVLADIHDALVDNSIITVKSAGGKAGSANPYPRPKRDKPEVDVVEVFDIDDFPIHAVMAMTAAGK